MTASQTTQDQEVAIVIDALPTDTDVADFTQILLSCLPYRWVRVRVAIVYGILGVFCLYLHHLSQETRSMSSWEPPPFQIIPSLSSGWFWVLAALVLFLVSAYAYNKIGKRRRFREAMEKLRDHPFRLKLTAQKVDLLDGSTVVVSIGWENFTVQKRHGAVILLFMGSMPMVWWSWRWVASLDDWERIVIWIDAHVPFSATGRKV